MPKPKNTITKSHLTAQLKRAKAEAAQLRRKTRDCRCNPMTKRTREEMIEELCNMVSHFHPADFDPEKLRARREGLETLGAPPEGPKELGPPREEPQKLRVQHEGNEPRTGFAGKDMPLH